MRKSALLGGAARLCVLTAFINAAPGEPLIESVSFDRAQYRPGQPVMLSVALRNIIGVPWIGGVNIRSEHLGHQVGIDAQRSITLLPGQTAVLSFNLGSGWDVGKGYLTRVQCTYQDGSVTDQANAAFDVDVDWTRFPRYGYLTKFTDAASAPQLIDPLKDLKVNAIQFYDWSDEHHLLYRAGHEYWQDIAARDPWVSRKKLTELILYARARNIASMAYILANGAYEGYADDGVRPEWGLYTRPRGSTPYSMSDQDRHELNIPAWETPRIYLMDPNNRDWQSWMCGQVTAALSAMPFDGVHVDSLGDRGARFNWSGEPVNLANGYASFVSALRRRVGRRPLVFNAVSQFGMSEVASSGARAVPYAEMWNELDDDFYDLKSSLARWRHQTGGRNAVVAGYLNSEYAKVHPGGAFHEPSVLLADAAMLANGGWHIGLGDGTAMLCSEYFPNNSLSVAPSTALRLRAWANFGVAYQNLLRDSVAEGFQRIDFDVGGEIQSGYDGGVGQVWKLSTTRPADACRPRYTIAHFVNLRSAGSTRWRDVDALSKTPEAISQRVVRMYFDGPWLASRVRCASPDYRDGACIEISGVQVGYDAVERRSYAEFTLPFLQYWTMAWIEHNPDFNADGVLDAGDLEPFERAPIDLNADGMVDDGDLACLRSRIGVTRTPRAR